LFASQEIFGTAELRLVWISSLEGSVPRWPCGVEQGVQGEEPFPGDEQHAFSGVAMGEGCAFGKPYFGKDSPSHPEGLGYSIKDQSLLSALLCLVSIIPTLHSRLNRYSLPLSALSPSG
jgi:hypothetical protein